MKIEIKPDMSIAYLNEAFRFFYPNLKLVFFEKTFSRNLKLAENEQVLDESTLLKDISSKEPIGVLNIEDDESTARFESDFEELFGLHVQVFRRSGNLWLMTTLTQAHTLKQQELDAEEFLHEKESIAAPPDSWDYREQD